MNKQATINVLKLVAQGMSKTANDEPVRAIKEAPVTVGSSLISSTPSSLVNDVISSPVNLSSASSASSGSGPGDVKWIMSKNIYGKPGAAISMLLPNTAALYYAAFGDRNKFNAGLNAGAAELRAKYGPRINSMKLPTPNLHSTTIPVFNHQDEAQYQARKQDMQVRMKEHEDAYNKAKKIIEDHRQKMGLQ